MNDWNKNDKVVLALAPKDVLIYLITRDFHFGNSFVNFESGTVWELVIKREASSTTARFISSSIVSTYRYTNQRYNYLFIHKVGIKNGNIIIYVIEYIPVNRKLLVSFYRMENKSCIGK